MPQGESIVNHDEHYTVTAGPQLHDFMNSLSQGGFGNGNPRLMVTMTVIPFGELRLTIEDIGRESNSGEDWIFRGLVRNGPSGLSKVHGYFNTRTFTGWMAFPRND